MYKFARLCDEHIDLNDSYLYNVICTLNVCSKHLPQRNGNARDL